MAAEKMIRLACIALAALSLLVWPNGAGAQENASARALASNYQLTDALGERKCPIALEARVAAPGFALTFDRPACRAAFAHLTDVVAWQPAPAGGINFVDAKGVAITEFSEGVGGVYEAIRENDGVYFLTNLRIADTPETQPTDLLGNWSLARPGGPTICTITLTNEAMGDGRFALRIMPGCDSAITAFAPVSWQLSSGDILLFSKGGSLIRLGRNEEGIWSRLPDQFQPRPRPLLMMR
ncbi:MAG TPA: AprI/Inh family metalloprotease inhibitor [Xanthobacteraceae bacterium]|nr:AprI/Inh family metalloprotease inhibitor [Xanthobacteraceae bacterium]